MTLTREQLEKIVAAALPGERLREHLPRPRGRVRLTLASGDRLDLHTFGDQPQASTAVAALRRLRAEIDLPVPALRASDAAGELAGVPCLLADPLEGEPLASVAAQLSEEQMHRVGLRLGEVAYRTHRLACGGYGPLLADGAPEERAYLLERLDAAILANQLTEQQATILREWFDAHFQPIGGGAALICGGLDPAALLVRHSPEGWALSGVLGWEHALGWVPAWEHAVFLEAARDARYFGLRIGYGKAYDDLTARTYEQVREGLLRPYRILLSLEQAPRAPSAAARDRHLRLLEALVELR